MSLRMHIACVQLTSRADKTVNLAAGAQLVTVVADSDLARLDAIRAALPALRHRQPETYRWPAP